MSEAQQQPTSRLDGFLCELRRRKVYRVAATYAVAGWVLIQIAATVFPALQLPAWSLRFVILAVLGGFPIALVLRRLVDVEPRGLATNGSLFRGGTLPARTPPEATQHSRAVWYPLRKDPRFRQLLVKYEKAPVLPEK